MAPSNAAAKAAAKASAAISPYRVESLLDISAVEAACARNGFTMQEWTSTLIDIFRAGQPQETLSASRELRAVIAACVEASGRMAHAEYRKNADGTVEMRLSARKILDKATPTQEIEDHAAIEDHIAEDITGEHIAFIPPEPPSHSQGDNGLSAVHDPPDDPPDDPDDSHRLDRGVDG